jgi:ClpP class serine protease
VDLVPSRSSIGGKGPPGVWSTRSIGTCLPRHFDSPGERAKELARTLSDGRWTHDFPIDVQMAHSLGLKVSTELPDEVRELMQLYPQQRGRRPSVEYIPLPYDAPSERKQTRRSSRSARS